MKIIDTKGLKCPQPLVMAKRALKEAGEDETIRLETDSDTSRDNLVRFLGDNGIRYSFTTEGNIHTFILNRSKGELPEMRHEEYCDTTFKPLGTIGEGPLVVVLDSETLGRGNDDLGTILMKNFLISLRESDRLPTTLLCYNSGAKLVIKESMVIDEMKQLEKAGVEVLVCGACLDFYNIKKDMACGKVSNMVEIVDRMNSASKIFYA